MIRYYGTYHPSVSRSDFVRNAHLIPAIHPTKRPFLRSLSRWRFSILASFSSDPLRCSCGSIMHFLFLKFKKTTLDNLFRKVLSYPLEHSLSSNPVLRSLFPKHNFITCVVANPPIRSVWLCRYVFILYFIASALLFAISCEKKRTQDSNRIKGFSCGGA